MASKLNDKEFEEYRKIKQSIKDKYLYRKVKDEIEQEDLEKFFKPISQPLKEQKELIAPALKAIEDRKDLKAIQYDIQQIPSSSTELIRSTPKAITDYSTINLGKIATKYLNEKTSNPVFEIRAEGKKLFIGNSEISVNFDDLIIEGKKYKGTEGLWALLTKKDIPEKYIDKNLEDFIDEDLKSYREILINSGSMFHNNDPNSNKPKSSRGEKYNKIIKLIRPRLRSQSLSPKKGYGLKIKNLNMKIYNNNKIDYKHWDDPNELAERLKFIVSEEIAGNNNLNNEKIEIIQELKEAGYIQ
jgi:hypothetical protein